MRITGKCKAKNLIRDITKAWVLHKHDIGPVWTLDETDTEILGRN
jgi:hypothetical protein